MHCPKALSPSPSCFVHFRAVSVWALFFSWDTRSFYCFFPVCTYVCDASSFLSNLSKLRSARTLRTLACVMIYAMSWHCIKMTLSRDFSNIILCSICVFFGRRRFLLRLSKELWAREHSRHSRSSLSRKWSMLSDLQACRFCYKNFCSKYRPALNGKVEIVQFQFREISRSMWYLALLTRM